MKRRNFPTWLGLGNIISWLNSNITIYTKGKNNIQSSTIKGNKTQSPGLMKSEGFVTIGTIQELKEKERIIVKQAKTSQ